MANQIGGQCGKSIVVALSPSQFDCDVAALDKTGLVAFVCTYRGGATEGGGSSLRVGQPSSLNARSLNAVAQRSPALASAIIFSATSAVAAVLLRSLCSPNRPPLPRVGRSQRRRELCSPGRVRPLKNNIMPAVWNRHERCGAHRTNFARTGTDSLRMLQLRVRDERAVGADGAQGQIPSAEACLGSARDLTSPGPVQKGRVLINRRR